MSSPRQLIGVFDSGVGGLSVLRAIRAELPTEPIMYFADQAHVPYGTRQLEEVRTFAHGITRYLLQQGASLIVVACNTASVAALKNLREDFPETPFVGMEPAVKPAAEQTHSGVVGVLATEATFQTEIYASVVERFSRGAIILEDPCMGLVAQIEKGNLAGSETHHILEKALKPMLEKGVDTIVMGCTHYPFVIPLIEQIVGPGVRVIDPAPAIARQVKRLLDARGLLSPQNQRGTMDFLTSGNPVEFARLLTLLLGESHPVNAVRWGRHGLEIDLSQKDWVTND